MAIVVDSLIYKLGILGEGTFYYLLNKQSSIIILSCAVCRTQSLLILAE